MIEFKTLLTTLFVAAWICGAMTYSLVLYIDRYNSLAPTLKRIHSNYFGCFVTILRGKFNGEVNTVFLELNRPTRAHNVLYNL